MHTQTLDLNISIAMYNAHKTQENAQKVHNALRAHVDVGGIHDLFLVNGRFQRQSCTTNDLSTHGTHITL